MLFVDQNNYYLRLYTNLIFIYQSQPYQICLHMGGIPNKANLHTNIV